MNFIKYLFLIFPFQLFAFNWIEGTKIHIISPSNNVAPQAVFFNSYTGVGAMHDVWTNVNLNNVIPQDAIAIHVIGILLITHGLTNEIADLNICFKNNESSNNCNNYHHQVIEAQIGGGQRSTMSAWIALDNNKSFQYKWKVKKLSQWPEYSAYGANLVIDSYIS